eukprot:280643-Rhodomonas_salina.1
MNAQSLEPRVVGRQSPSREFAAKEAAYAVKEIDAACKTQVTTLRVHHTPFESRHSPSLSCFALNRFSVVHDLSPNAPKSILKIHFLSRN